MLWGFAVLGFGFLFDSGFRVYIVDGFTGFDAIELCGFAFRGLHLL